MNASETKHTPVAWRVLAEPDLPVHFARTKADADHLVNNLLTYRKGCTKAWAEPLYLISTATSSPIPDDTLNEIAADNEAARDDEFNTWTDGDDKH
ncbi:hypothetical protein [Mesorhizobium wenxiniae]|nr:hypothetical protein [Mesorhizobium wenxiniae]